MREAPIQLKAAVLALRSATSNITAYVDSAFASEFTSPWQEQVEAATQRPLDQVLATGLSVHGTAGRGPGFLMGANHFGTVGRGLIPIEHWAGIEFGVIHPAEPRTYVRRAPRTGTPHTVTRNVLAGHPWRARNGRVYHRAIGALIPRMASFFTQSVIRAFMDAAEEGRNG